MGIAEKTQGANPRVGRAVPLQVNVVYTDRPATRAALRKAVELTASLEASLRVVVLKMVPFPLELDNPPISKRFDRRRVLRIVDEVTPEANVQMCYCRDEADAIFYLLNSDSIAPNQTRSS